MVVCANCGEDDFYEQDGFFFCSVCQSQSQQFRHEGLERCFGDPSALPASQVELTSQSQTRKKQRDRGRIWMLEEGFTVILKKQVEQLINRGASPELKDKVFKLWMHYLRTNKVAFCKDAKWLQNRHQRNFRAGRKRQRLRFELTMSEKKVDDAIDDDCQEDSYVGEDPNDSESSEDEYCLDLNDYGRRDITMPEWMTVRKTPVFLYLGLLYSGHNVTLVDLIRWAKDDVYLLKDVSTCLNSDMKFIDKGIATTTVFRMKAAPPSVNALRRQCDVMATHLGLDNIPAPDMKQLVTSYVIRLALPGELHGSIRYLMKEVPTKFEPSSHPPNYDAIAIAYIIIALKLMLGFDEFRERQLSSYAREITRKLHLRQKLFIWDDWVNMHEKRRKRFKQQECPRNLQDASELTNIGQFVERHKVVMTNMERQYATVSQTKAFQKEVARPLESLLSKMPDPTDGATNNEPESEPLFSETLMEDFEPTPRDNQPTTKTVKPVLTKEELAFSSTTLRYISEGVDFLEHLGNHGIADTTLSMYGMDQEEDTASEETNRVIAVIRQAILLGLSSDRQVIDPDDPITQLSQRLSLKKDCYMIYNFGNNTWHTSYEWLLKLCSEMIYTDPAYIQSQVRVIELILFKVSSKNSRVQTVALGRQAGHFDPDKVISCQKEDTEEEEDL